MELLYYSKRFSHTYLAAGSDDNIPQVLTCQDFLTFLVANIVEVGVSYHTLDVGCGQIRYQVVIIIDTKNVSLPREHLKNSYHKN